MGNGLGPAQIVIGEADLVAVAVGLLHQQAIDAFPSPHEIQRFRGKL